MAVAFLVRLAANHDLVGFFVADSVEALWVAVDECADLDACEHALLPNGGIHWGSPAVAVPIDVTEEELAGRDERKIPWNRCELSDQWWDFIYGDEDSVLLPLIGTWDAIWKTVKSCRRQQTTHDGWAL
jgi:hypothetical protein